MAVLAPRQVALADAFGEGVGQRTDVIESQTPSLAERPQVTTKRLVTAFCHAGLQRAWLRKISTPSTMAEQPAIGRGRRAGPVPRSRPRFNSWWCENCGVDAETRGRAPSPGGVTPGSFPSLSSSTKIGGDVQPGRSVPVVPGLRPGSSGASTCSGQGVGSRGLRRSRRGTHASRAQVPAPVHRARSNRGYKP